MSLLTLFFTFLFSLSFASEVDVITLGCDISVGTQAPEGWFLDQKTGQKYGNLCGFYYQKGSDFNSATSVVYSKVSGHKTINHILEDAIGAYSVSSKFKRTELKTYETANKLKFEVHEFSHGPKPNEFELVGYHQLKSCVLVVVYSSRTEVEFKKDSQKFYEFLDHVKIYSNTIKPLVGNCLYPKLK